MSNQWGHGFNKGHKEGVGDGVDIGLTVGQLSVGDHAWHTVNAAISAFENGDDLQGLMLLRTLQFALAAATGHEAPPFNKMMGQ